MKEIMMLLIGLALGLLFSIFTGVGDAQLVKHNCAYSNKHTGELTWYDTNTTVH